MTVDRVRNPWRLHSAVVVFDVETECGKVWTEADKRRRKFLCGVVYDYDTGRFQEYKSAAPLVRHLRRARVIVSYNGEGFDFLVPAKHSLKLKPCGDRFQPVGVRSLDIMHEIQTSEGPIGR